MRDRLLARIQRAIEEKAGSLSRHVSAGGCDTLADYKHQVGKIEGLSEALRIMDDESRALREDGDID